jgi:hypothetical protein
MGLRRDPQPKSNADQLEHSLAFNRAKLEMIEDDDERARRMAAIEEAERYVALLRDGAARRAFSFKLEFGDGRWDVDERSLAAEPRIGDEVSFDDGRRWRVRGFQVVAARPAHKPSRRFLVCAPVV